MDIFEDWNMIVAGIKQTYGDIDILGMRARDFFNIYLPNMSKDTTIMQIVRIRQTPNNKLSKEERKIKLQYRLKQPALNNSNGFIEFLRRNSKAGEK